MDNHLLITVPVYSAEKYIKECIDSIKNQKYTNWKCIIIDDCSTDNTFNIINENVNARFIVVNNKENKGALYNIDYAIEQFGEENDIIVNVDGDDCLYDNTVLDTINSVYQNENKWLTYGSLIFESNRKQFPIEKLESASNCRWLKWKTTHLRTYRRKLYLKINKNDLKHKQTGDFFKVAPDLAFMFPMVEMAGDERIEYIDKLMYIYHDNTGINEFRIRLAEQRATERFIRRKYQPYKRLEKL